MPDVLVAETERIRYMWGGVRGSKLTKAGYLTLCVAFLRNNHVTPQKQSYYTSVSSFAPHPGLMVFRNVKLPTSSPSPLSHKIQAVFKTDFAPVACEIVFRKTIFTM